VPPLSFAQPCGLRVWETEIQRPEYQLQPGFCYSRVEGCQDSFRFAALIDLHKLPNLFNACATLLAEESFFVLEYYPQKITKDDEDTLPEPSVFYSPYMPTADILDLLVPYMERLIHDGFVGFGIANSRQGVELFYSEEKAFTCFTASHLRTTNIFTKYGLTYVNELLFPADFAHDHLSLVSLSSEQLPPELRHFSRDDLDYIHYCAELIELFDMQSTADGEEFFLSGKEQDYIGALLEQQPDLDWSSDDEFIHLMMDWKDFVRECSQGFTGDLEDYAYGLMLRDTIATVIDGSDTSISKKLSEFVAEADNIFRRLLVETTRHIPSSKTVQHRHHKRFWHWGVTRKQGTTLRRDLIRSGWFAHR
jgi:hypothetical protein